MMRTSYLNGSAYRFILCRDTCTEIHVYMELFSYPRESLQNYS